MYPSAPDFSVGLPTDFGADNNYRLPAWWQYTMDDGSIDVCETTGSSVIDHARTALSLSANETWDNDLQNALITQATTLSASQSGDWTDLISDLQNALNTQVVSQNSLIFAIWIAYYQANGLRLDVLYVPPGAVMPTWGVAVPLNPGGDLFACWNVNRDPQPQDQASYAIAAPQSTDGVRLLAGQSPPAAQTPVPPGPSGLSTPWLIGIGILVVGSVALIAWTNETYVKTVEA